MPDINLLPWRELRRKRLEREFYVMLGSASLCSVLAMLLVHLVIAGRIDLQQRRNQLLTSQISLLDQRIKTIQELEKDKKNLLDRMDVIQRLQASRTEVVHLFDALSKAVPTGVQLLDLSQVEKSITIDGIAESNARVSVFMRNLDMSPWFLEPLLQVIETKPSEPNKKTNLASKFTLHVIQAEEEGERTGENKPASPANSKPMP